MKYTNHQYMTKIFHFLRKKLGITASDSTFVNESIKDKRVDMVNVHVSSSMKAAIHLGPNSLANLEVYKNTNSEEIQSLFNITQKLVSDHSSEILNVNTMQSTSPSCTRSVFVS